MKKYHFFIGILVSIMAIYLACRKIDRQTAIGDNKNSVELKFFTSHRSSNPLENSLVSYLKRENGKIQFCKQGNKSDRVSVLE